MAAAAENPRNDIDFAEQFLNEGKLVEVRHIAQSLVERFPDKVYGYRILGLLAIRMH